MSATVPPLNSEQAYSAHSGHGSVGPVVGVLAVIAVLGVIAGMVGRLCSGRRIMGRGLGDVEGWLQSKCSSCIDGRADPPPQAAGIGGGGSVEATAAAEDAVGTTEGGEIKEEEPAVRNGT